MIKFENVEVHGLNAAIRGMRNPMNSWDRSDSEFCKNYITHEANCGFCDDGCIDGLYLGPKDLDLARRLAKGGPVHGKYLRTITVYVDITAPLYWWKEFDTYKVGTVSNSTSTMYKIHAKEFTMDDFSHEHLISPLNEDIKWGDIVPTEVMLIVIEALNKYRDLFIETKDKRYWWQMIQLLPSSYNQKRTIMMNYAVLMNQYKYRKNHKLDEWHDYCDWVLMLPFFKEICVAE